MAALSLLLNHKQRNCRCVGRYSQLAIVVRCCSSLLWLFTALIVSCHCCSLLLWFIVDCSTPAAPLLKRNHQATPSPDRFPDTQPPLPQPLEPLSIYFITHSFQISNIPLVISFPSPTKPSNSQASHLQTLEAQRRPSHHHENHQRSLRRLDGDRSARLQHVNCSRAHLGRGSPQDRVERHLRGHSRLHSQLHSPQRPPGWQRRQQPAHNPGCRGQRGCSHVPPQPTEGPTDEQLPGPVSSTRRPDRPSLPGEWSCHQVGYAGRPHSWKWNCVHLRHPGRCRH